MTINTENVGSYIISSQQFTQRDDLKTLHFQCSKKIHLLNFEGHSLADFHCY